MTVLVRSALLVSALTLGGLCQSGSNAFGYNPLCNESFSNANAVWHISTLFVPSVADGSRRPESTTTILTSIKGSKLASQITTLARLRILASLSR